MSLDHAVPTFTEQTFSKDGAMTDWEQINSLTTNALEIGDYDAVIDHSSSTVGDLQRRLVQLLKMRVVAWGRKGQYKEELKEASTIIQYAPHDPAGYLCMGRRYADQGHQTNAIKVFNKGLYYVPQSHPQYKALEDAKQCALERRGRRIDIIARAPFDIMSIILDQIPPKTLVSCIKVSPINIESFIDEEDDTTLSRVFRILPLISPHVRELSVPHAPWLPSCLKLIGSENFTSLQSLQIRKSDIDEYAFADYCKPLQECLPNIAESLTSLDIQYYGESIVLSEILDICRSLTTIIFHDEGGRYVFNGLALPFNTSLRKVVLSGTVISSDVVALLQCSPNLRYLALTQPIGNIYAELSENCTSIINTLKIGYDTYDLNDAMDVDSGAIIGLTNLSANHSLSSLTLAPYVNKHSATLRCLRISFESYHGRSRANWGTLSSFELDGLTSLHLEGVPQPVTDDLSRLFERCSKLEKISLKAVSTSIPEQAFVAASQLKQLISFQLQHAVFSEQSMLQFLSGIQQQQNERKGLMELKLDDKGEVTGAVLVACTAIKSLTSLTVNSYNEIEPSDERNFAIGLGHLPRLQKLCLSNLELSEQSLLSISESKSLKDVKLDSIYYLTAIQIQDAFPSHVAVKFKEYYA